jgi:hypothetical protein
VTKFSPYSTPYHYPRETAVNITKLHLRPMADLMNGMRGITMLQDKNTKPYEQAEIGVATFHTDELAPAQRYVLRAEFEKVRELRWALTESWD